MRLTVKTASDPCDALRNIVPFVQFKNVKNIRVGVLLIVLKVTLLHGCFSRFLNCTNGTESFNPFISYVHRRNTLLTDVLRSTIHTSPRKMKRHFQQYKHWVKRSAPSCSITGCYTWLSHNATLQIVFCARLFFYIPKSQINVNTKIHSFFDLT